MSRLFTFILFKAILFTGIYYLSKYLVRTSLNAYDTVTSK